MDLPSLLQQAVPVVRASNSVISLMALLAVSVAVITELRRMVSLYF